MGALALSSSMGSRSLPHPFSKLCQVSPNPCSLQRSQTSPGPQGAQSCLVTHCHHHSVLETSFVPGSG